MCISWFLLAPCCSYEAASLSLSSVMLHAAPDLNPIETNPKLLNQCIGYITDDIRNGNANIMTATTALSNASRKIAASDLKIPDHFKKVPLQQLGSADFPVNLASKVEGYLQRSRDLCEHGLIPAIAKCETDVLENLSLLKVGIRNEMELRFAVADPILKLLCSYWGLKVCGEVWGNYFCCRVLN